MGIPGTSGSVGRRGREGEREGGRDEGRKGERERERVREKQIETT